jgi:hypothetical protein
MIEDAKRTTIKHGPFSDNPKGKKPKVKLQYGSAKEARETIKRLQHTRKSYQRQAASTMYYRAKFHRFQTKGMKQASEVYKKFLNRLAKE